MDLTKRQLRFLKPARSRDRYRLNLRSMWCMKRNKAAVATDGFTLHAVPIPEPSSDFPFRQVTDVNGQTTYSLAAHADGDAPRIEFAKPGTPQASMLINPAFLQRTLDALSGHNTMKLSISKFGKDGHMLVLQGIEDNVGAYCALIMGMYEGSFSGEFWSPWSTKEEA